MKFLPLGPYSTALHIPNSNVHGVHLLQDYMEIADMLVAAALEKENLKLQDRPLPTIISATSQQQRLKYLCRHLELK